MPYILFFFCFCRYKVDETSPVQTLVDEFDYEILSKMNPRKVNEIPHWIV